MKIKHVSIKKIKPYKLNAKIHPKDQIVKIANSIKEFGFKQPIVIDKNQSIIVGHGRYLAAKHLKLKSVPCLLAHDLTPAQVKAYRLADNKLNESDGDLDLVIPELKSMHVDLAKLTGSDLDILIEEEGKDDEVPEVPKKAKSKPGEVYWLGNHRLMCGDSTKKEDVEKLMDGNIVNLMVTDPPYGVEYDPAWRERHDLGVGERSKGKVANDDRVDWRDAYNLFNGDVAYVWHGARHAPEVGQNLIDCGFDIVAQIIWTKQHFVLSRGDYHWQHEPCYYVVKKGQKHNWQGSRKETTVWDIKNNNSFGNSKREETWGHGTQKPVECMAKPIKNSSARGTNVYDPFGGSGTTLIAAEKLDRKCFMMEIDPLYIDVIIKRWEDFTGEKAELVEGGGK